MIEQAFIGAIIMMPDLLSETTVKAEYLVDPIARQAYLALQSMTAIDAVALNRKINQEKWIGQAIENATSEPMDKYSAMIKDNYRKVKVRKAIQEAAEITDIDAAIAHIVDAGEIEQESEYRDMTDILTPIRQAIETRSMGKTAAYNCIPTGFHSLDQIIGGLEKGYLTIIAGRASMGKSSLAFNIAANASMSHNVCINSLEMDNASVSYRLLSTITKLDLQMLRLGRIESKQSWSKLASATLDIAKMNLYLDTNPRRSVANITACAKRHQRIHGLDMLMIDYIGLMDVENMRDQRYRQIGEITRKLKQLAMELKISVVLLSQLNREAEGREPNMSHMRESGDIEQNADVVLFPYRPGEEDANGPRIIIGKNRNGPTGRAWVNWNAECATFENANTRDF